MRKALTDAELKLWNALRDHRLMGLSFRPQMPIADNIVDFASPSHRLIVELGGSQHGATEAVTYADKRTIRLQRDGWTVVRFWNDDALKDIDAVCLHIVLTTGARMP